LVVFSWEKNLGDLSSMPNDSTPATVPTGIALSAFNPVFRECPHKILNELRAADPVHRDRQFDRLVLTRHADIESALADRTLGTDPRKARPGSFIRLALGVDETYEPTMLNTDDPEHRRLRALVAQTFNQRSVDSIRPRITSIAETLLEGLAGKVSFDIIDEFAGPLPTIVIAEMLGVDAADRKDFKRWSNAMGHLLNPRRTPEQDALLISGRENLTAYFSRVIAQRRMSRGADLISALVAAEEDSDKLTEHEIINTAKLLLVAGNVTTTDLIGNGIVAFLRDPEQLAKLRERPSLARNAIEEVLRFDPPVVSMARVNHVERQIGEVMVGAGQTVDCFLIAAGRDPALHADPDRFDIERTDTRHSAFGGGAHFCLGAPLARAQAQIAIPMLFQRFPHLRLEPGRTIEHKVTPPFNGLKELWVRTD
jgi:cytochrome P450